MPNVNLSADFVRTAVCPEGKSKIDFYDNSTVGFILECRSSGGKTFALRYRNAHGKQCQHKIADAQSISFDKARQAAQMLRSRVVLGESPSEERKTQRLIPTLAEFAADTYLAHIKATKRSWDTDDSMLRNHVLPRFGKLHLDEITQQLVTDLYHGMVHTSGYAQGTANRMLVMLHSLFSWAKKAQIPGAEINPTEGVKLVDPKNARERFLSSEETKRLRDALQESQNPQLQYIVPLLLLTGARKRELLDSRWQDFDMERKSWRIPMTKSGKPRHVPLSSSVLSILAQLPRWPGCDFVVPNPKTRKPFVSVFCAWNSARKQAGLPEVRMHDLRHSMASNMVNSGRTILEVSRVLGHTQLKTSMRYSHLSQETLLAAVDASANATGIDWGPAQTAKAGDNLALAAA